MLLEKVIRLTLLFIVNIKVAVYLGPSLYGELNYAINVVGLLTVLTTLGLDYIVVKKLIDQPEDELKILGTTLLLKLIGGILVFCLISLYVLMSNETQSIKTFLLIISASYWLYSLNVIDYYYQSKTYFKKIAYVQIAQVFITSSIRLIGIYLHADVIWFVFSWTFDLLFLALLFLISFRKPKIFKWKIDFAIFKDLIRISLPLMLAGIAHSIYMRFDQIMVAQLVSNTAAGYYSFAVKIVNTLNFIPLVIVNAFYPSLTKLGIFSNRAKDRFRLLASICVFILVIIACLITLFSDFIIISIAGESYLDASIILKVYVWSTVFLALGIIRNRYLMIASLEKLTLYYSLTGAAINIILNFVLIKYYGFAGAAFSTLITHFIVGYLVLYLRNDTRELFYLQSKGIKDCLSMSFFKKIKKAANVT